MREKKSREEKKRKHSELVQKVDNLQMEEQKNKKEKSELETKLKQKDDNLQMEEQKNKKEKSELETKLKQKDEEIFSLQTKLDRCFANEQEILKLKNLIKKLNAKNDVLEEDLKLTKVDAEKCKGFTLHFIQKKCNKHLRILLEKKKNGK